MKKTIAILLTASALSFSATNLTDDPKDMGDKYCAKMKDGKLSVMHNGMAMTSDVTLANGTQITTDGTIIKKDGTRMMMKEGECINKDGKMMESKSEKKKEKETNKEKTGTKGY